MRAEQDGVAGLPSADLLAQVAARLGPAADLDTTVRDVADVVVDLLGFEMAVVNLLGDDGDLHAVAVAGPPGADETLLGTSLSVAQWTVLLDAAEPHGRLRLLDHRTPVDKGDVVWWSSGEPVEDEDDAWHPDDALFAPLLASDGTLLGVLSFDLPGGRRRPSAGTLGMLEVVALLAQVAVDHALLAQRLRASETRFRSTFADAPVGMALFDDGSRLVEANRAFCAFLGRDLDWLRGRRAEEFTHPDDIAVTKASSADVRAGRGRVYQTEKRYLAADGTTKWGRLSLTRLGLTEGDVVVAQVEDVTERKQAEAELVHRALHDPLTGLPNRTLLLDRLEQSLARSQRDEGMVAVLFCDVDHFKLVNDTLGHSAGDELLGHVARTLTGLLRGSDTAGRLGGDEFVLVLDGLAGPAEAIAVAERLQAAVRGPIVVASGDEVITQLSVGIAMANDGSSAAQLLADADAALYRAKAAGRARWEVFDGDMREAALAQIALRSEVSRAVAGNQLRLHYQPIVELASGRTAGFEALLRWQHPERGLLLPADFLAVVEDGDASSEVAEWVLDRAVADAAAWPAHFGAEPFVSINVSPRQLGRPDLAGRVRRALERHGLPPERLWVEITEDRLVAGDSDVRDLARLRELGVRVALDDFGTGYSGLTYLQSLPADILKVDKGFVAGLGSDPVSEGIVRAVGELATVLGLEVVAEGIETQQQAAVLRRLGLRYGQGYWLGRPAPLPARSAAALPRGGDTGPMQVTLSPDLAGELRRCEASLACAGSALEVGRLAVQAAFRVAAVDGAMFFLVDGDQFRLVHGAGYTDDALHRWQTFHVASPVPAAEAVRAGQPVWAEGVQVPAEAHERSERGPAELSVVALPLGSAAALTMSWSQPVELSDSVRAHLTALADVVSARLAGLGRPSPVGRT